MNRNLLAFILMLAGVAVIIFGKQLGASIYVSRFVPFIAGPVLFIIGAARLELKAAPRYMSGEDQLVSYLKTHGDKIVVELAVCEIKEDHYSEDSEKNSSLSWGLTGTFANGGLYPLDNVEHQEGARSVIVFECIYKEKPVQFRSHIISKDKTSLLFHIYGKKETCIYIDPNDKNTYYFDLEFLYQ